LYTSTPQANFAKFVSLIGNDPFSKRTMLRDRRMSWLALRSFVRTVAMSPRLFYYNCRMGDLIARNCATSLFQQNSQTGASM
jgi:hypothetical protein